MEIMLAVPMPKSMETASEMVISGSTSERPPRAISFTPCPTKMRSTTLYSALTSIPVMAGMEKRRRSLLTGSVPRRLAASCGGLLMLVSDIN